ncbi:MAG: pilus assembly protein N-terminal domain-containing protein [Cyanobacteria bacterium TGS_CYA1]|nr:pilus assembly protein N-terminal domain-containing protein [Cyanobacteria bacterium TGS_CYA1]
MNKSQTKGLALSMSLFVTQVSLMAPASAKDAIWQTLSNSSTPSKAPATKKKAVKKTVAKVTTKQVANQGQIMLLMGNGSDKNSELAPDAALSIHPGLEQPAITASADIKQVPLTPGSSESVEQLDLKFAPKNEFKSKQLLAQLAPDTVISQASGSDVTAIPIPPVVTGAVEMEEFKSTNVIDLKVSQSRTFKLRNKVVRTSISDPGIAEPVIISENQMVLLGKSPGTATMVLWDDAGNTAAIDLTVSRDYTELQNALREIDPRIIVKAFSVGGSDRVLLMGDVDHPESVSRAFLASNVFMDDRGMNIQASNNRLINARIGEQGAMGGGGGGGGSTGRLATLASVDRYTFFPNTNNNISKAQVISSDGGRVTSLIKVRKVPLIVLHCTFMEMNTTSARELSTALGVNSAAQGFAFGVGGTTGPLNVNNPGLLHPFGGINQIVSTTVGAEGNPLPIFPSGTGVGYLTAPVGFNNVNTVGAGAIGGGPMQNIGLPVALVDPATIAQSVLFGAPGGTAFSTASLLNMFTSNATFASGGRSRTSVTPQVQGIISNQRARILSEPSLVVLSGERAAFLAGGEIPIVQAVAAAGQSQQSVVFEPFGLRLNFIPVLMENGSINIQISPEERIPTTQVGFTFNIPLSTTVIPGFITRKAQTIVEMKPGQELFIGGLVTSNNGRDLVKLPIIGEIPVLGAIYRSKAFAKNESELVVAIRPEVILPGTPGQLKLPEEIGRVEGPRDMNLFQVEPTVMDERHYTSGRSERHQKTSPTLPEGAPIPDSN